MKAVHYCVRLIPPKTITAFGLCERICKKAAYRGLLLAQLRPYCLKLSSSLARLVVEVIMQSLALTLASEPPSGSL